MTEVDQALADARLAYRNREWAAAYDALSELAEADQLGPEDTELLATASYMLGNVPDMLDAQDRAYRGYIDGKHPLPAARVAFWIAAGLASRGKFDEASGWIERGTRLLEPVSEPCVELGYSLLPTALRHMLSGEMEEMESVSSEAANIGREFQDPDLLALAAQTQARALLHLGKSVEAFRILDEVMLLVLADECAPMVTGLVYCAVLEGCYESHEVRRATQWTESLSEWCGTQPDLVAFTDQCLAHRSEILRLKGAWSDALLEAHRSHKSHARGFAAAQAHYQEAEIYRMQGQFDRAEESYEGAALRGGSAQPGLARLRLAQGNEDAAVASIRRALMEADDLLTRVAILPGYIEVMVSTGHLEDAGRGVGELSEIAKQTGVDMHQAWAASGAGAWRTASGLPEEAAPLLRQAIRGWEKLGLPYDLARARLELGRALAAMGDVDAAGLQFRAARDAFNELGAEPDSRNVEKLLSAAGRDQPFGLTRRELEVLGLLASGATNRAIAEKLVLSERTIDRHVSNIFAKLGVNNRSAATALAIRSGLA